MNQRDTDVMESVVKSAVAIFVDSKDVCVSLGLELWNQQLLGIHVDLALAFSCGTICVVHKCVVTAMSR